MEIEPLTEKEYRRRQHLESIRGRGVGYLILRDIAFAVAGIALYDLFKAHGDAQSWVRVLRSNDSGEWISAAITGCVGGYMEWSSKEKELAKLDARSKAAGEIPYSDHAANSL